MKVEVALHLKCCSCAKHETGLEAARTHVAWGQFLRDRGDLAAAHEHLERAAAQFEASGLTEELERTRRALADLTG